MEQSLDFGHFLDWKYWKANWLVCIFKEIKISWIRLVKLYYRYILLSTIWKLSWIRRNMELYLFANAQKLKRTYWRLNLENFRKCLTRIEVKMSIGLMFTWTKNSVYKVKRSKWSLKNGWKNYYLRSKMGFHIIFFTMVSSIIQVEVQSINLFILIKTQRTKTYMWTWQL